MHWLPGLMTAMLLGVAGVAWNAARSNAPLHHVATAAVERGDIEDAVVALGTLQPREFVDVGTQVSGRLERLHVSIGDKVEAGTLLAAIDAAVPSARVEAGQATLRNLGAQLDERRAQLDLAQRQHARARSLRQADAISQEAVDSAAAAARVAAAQISALQALQQQTRANLKIEQAQVGYARIHAPIAGTVVALYARPGQTLNASQQAPLILRVADLSSMTVVAQVSEADVVRLVPGTDVHFHTLGWAERRWSAKVRQILPTPETLNNVVLYNVLFDVANPDQRLKPQMSAQVYFVLGRARDALLVPTAALKPRKAAAPAGGGDAEGAPTRWRARVLVEGRIEEREVTVGVRNRTQAQVVAGLQEGEQVVIGAAPREGERRKPASTPSTPPATSTARVAQR
ncbi:MAG: efflux RND transporter periplasmic adaptor subunit [Burkholderiaceae bacterium]